MVVSGGGGGGVKERVRMRDCMCAICLPEAMFVSLHREHLLASFRVMTLSVFAWFGYVHMDATDSTFRNR